MHLCVEPPVRRMHPMHSCVESHASHAQIDQADERDRTALSYAALYGSDNCVHVLAAHGEGEQMLLGACWQQHLGR